MPIPTIDDLPEAPIRSETPSTFTAKAEAWVAALAGWTTQVNDLAAYLVGLTGSAGPIVSTALTMATGKLLGRTSSSSGAIEEISIGAGLSLSGGVLGTRNTVQIAVTDPGGAAFTVGDGKVYFRVPSTLNGKSLVAVAAAVTTPSSSGAVNVMLANASTGHDMLSTALTIDASETDTLTAATPAAINATYAAVATGNLLRVDLDGAGTGAKGLIVEMQFQ